ncbi:hypothetical protein V2J09_005769 [Rumex salicifolius]
MKSLRALKALSTNASLKSQIPRFAPSILRQLYSSLHELESTASTNSGTSASENDSDAEAPAFDSSQFNLPPQSFSKAPQSSTWDEKYRNEANKRIFGEETSAVNGGLRVKEEVEEERKKRALAKALLQAAIDEVVEEDEEEVRMVKEEDQKSLTVGIIGAPNAGKSALTNYMVGTKVAAVSRKTNTTLMEVLGLMTKGNTQICFFDTPGLMLKKSGYPHKDIKARIESAWNSVDLYDVLVVIFDAHRQLTKPDSRVEKLIRRMGSEANPKQKRILCMNKVDLVENKKDLLKIAEEFKDLKGYEKVFMISGLLGSGVKDLSEYLMEQAVKRPWHEDPFVMSEEVMKNISLEVVREKLLHHVHQEIPYEIEHRLKGWKDLRDGSLRIEQHLITHKQSQRKILVGKNGSKIGRIGLEANEELRSIFKREVHLYIQVIVK